jgi:hypothetical protein
MTRAAALALTDAQLALVQRHAAALPVALRDRYLREVADRLRGQPSDAALLAAINLALDRVHAFQQKVST